MIFVRTPVVEKTGLKISQADYSGGTTFTGSVAKRDFSNESRFIEFLYWLTVFCVIFFEDCRVRKLPEICHFWENPVEFRVHIGHLVLLSRLQLIYI